ncbi:hypothetical protein G4B88_018976 [Cannabis sativa]|uniref:Uncharacterized protein n=1 Tax=Cannabis sativa TaxID=3483 RepID=A0A7J6H2Q6_CANSA|nr:hypothetical protein G4B88_018976 [Cannabis sativa]
MADDLTRQNSSNRSISNSFRSNTVKEMWNAPDAFQRSSRREEEEEELRWAAIERLPTYDRMRRGMLTQMVVEEVDVTKLGSQDKKLLMESILKVVEDDNEKFLERLRARNDRDSELEMIIDCVLTVLFCLVYEENERKFIEKGKLVGIEIPKVEVRFENLSIEGDAYVGTRALPTC